MTLTVAQLRSREDAIDCAYLIAFDGLPDMFVTGHPGEGLIGSGAGSWIGSWESGEGLAYTRTVHAGLIMPGSLEKERLDLKTGMPESTGATLTLVDFDGTIASMFAQEGKDYDLLGENIPPGTSALGASVNVQGGGTVNPRGRHIGHERIGPSGERVYLSCLPFTRIGPHHAVNVFGQQDEGPSPIKVSVDPIDHAGRWCTVYRLYRDPHTGEWPSWGDQYVANGYEFLGKLLDHGELGGDRKWTVKCSGVESILRKTLNNHAMSSWMTIEPTLNLNDDERGLAIECWYVDFTSGAKTTRLSASFDVTTLFPATCTRQQAHTTLDTDLDDVVAGTLSDYGTGALSAWNNSDCYITQSGKFVVKTDAPIAPSTDLTSEPVFVSFIMHEKVWRILGWDPPLQNSDSNLVDSAYQVKFVKMNAGDDIHNDTTSVVPGDGYWAAFFHTIEIGEDDGSWGPNNGGLDNRGNPREFWPMYAGDVQILSADGDQQIGLGLDFPFIEADPPVPFSSGTIGGSAVTGARHFVFKGRIAKAHVGDDGDLHAIDNGALLDGTAVEGTDLVVPAVVEFRAGTSYGQITEVSGNATARIQKWLHPRWFGFYHMPLDGEWAGVNDLANPDFRIVCLPLASYGYNDADAPAEYREQSTGIDLASNVLCQLLLSSGTATGWSDDYEADPTFTRGSNMTAGDSFWAGDCKKYDLGLAIPYQLVADVDDIASAFDELPDGVTGPLNHVRYAYAGPFESLDLLESILRPRGLAVSLSGGQFGVVRLGLFAPSNVEFEIGEGDLDDAYGEAIGQQHRAMGHLDETTIHLRWDPVEGEHAVERKYRARDPNAKDRLGDLDLELRDDGLCPWNADGIKAHESMLALHDLWVKDRPEFYAKRHFKVTGLRVSRIKGQDLHIGTRISLTNPWVMGSDGTYGVTDVLGIITSVELLPNEHVYVCEALIFADQGETFRLWGPIGVISGISGAVVTLDETEPYAPASAFNVPSWNATASAAEVLIVSHDLTNWTVSGPYTISSIAGAAITLTGAPGLLFRDRDMFLIMANYDQQDAGRWPRDDLSVVVLGTHSFGTGPTKGWPLLP